MNKNTRENMEQIMKLNPELRNKLFARGFLFTGAEVNEMEYPFYGLWEKHKLGEYTLLVASKQKAHIKGSGDKKLILVGHAYNPFSMCALETEILDSLFNVKFMSEEFWRKFNEITGIFTLICINDKRVYVLGDCTCMQTTFYGIIDKIEEIRAILEWNTGNIIPINKNDVRKRAFFADIEDFDVEVKSWVSEVGRSYYSKRFNGRTKFGEKPTPRKCTTMYKFFLNDRKLVKQTDKVFEEYLNKYFEQAKENPVEWQEQLFWEYRMPS